MTLTSKYQLIATLPYSSVTHDDGAAAGNVVYVEARRLPGENVRIRRTASNAGRQRSATRDISAEEYRDRYGA